MKETFWTKPRVAIAVGFCIVIALIILMPFFHWNPRWGSEHRIEVYSYFGIWIQGILTPILVVVAIVSFWLQAQAFREQTRTQNESNRIATRAFFMSNLERLEGHLAYRCYCALVNCTPGDITATASKRGEVLNTMSTKFNDNDETQEVRKIEEHPVLSLATMRKTSHYAVLAQELEEILGLGAQADLVGLFDNRIRRIRDGIKKYPPA